MEKGSADVPCREDSADVPCREGSAGGADVPCGDCIACCTSSYFIHIGSGESRALGRIPKELLFPAPGLPKGNVLMGYDEQGRCPMLVDGKCSIYEDRPQTCRDYDCRVFTAAGIKAGESDKELIDRRVSQWRFSYPGAGDRREHAAVKAAAKFLREHADSLPDELVPHTPSQLAILAIKVYDAFEGQAPADREGQASGSGRVPADREIVAAVVEKVKQFEVSGPR
jgi:Fe-S-cluster containining protein